MLHHKQQIEGNRDVAEQEFGRVACDAAPVFVEAGVEQELDEGEEAASEVEEDHFDTPTLG